MSDNRLREIVRKAVQAALHADSETDAINQNVITQWVCISESMAPDGSRLLSRLSGDASDAAPPQWATEGLLHNALYGEGWTDE